MARTDEERWKIQFSRLRRAAKRIRDEEQLELLKKQREQLSITPRVTPIVRKPREAPLRRIKNYKLNDYYWFKNNGWVIRKW